MLWRTNMAIKIVYSFDELKSAITDANTTEIQLGGDIAFSSGGVVIPRNKGDMVLDGRGFKITDYNSSSSGDCIRFSDTLSSPMKFTVKDIVWSGRNYFGIIYFPSGSNMSNMTFVLDNVDYTGLQAVYHRAGITRLVNSRFIISENGTGRTVNELCETNSLFVEGKVDVNCTGSVNAVVWLCNSNSAFTVEENSVLTVKAPGTYMFYADGSAINMTLKKNSVTDISTYKGLFNVVSSSLHMASPFVLEENASFSAIQEIQNPAGVPSFQCYNAFTLKKGSMFFLAAPSYGNLPLLYFAQTATVTFDNPGSVVLYNNGGKAIAFRTGSTAAPNVITIDAELMNVWNIATAPLNSAGGFEDIPSTAFQKADGGNINATVRATSSVMVSVESNITEGDKGFPMSTLNILDKQVVSIGTLPVAIETISDRAEIVKGATMPKAKVRFAFDGTMQETAADGQGNFEISLSVPLPAGIETETSVNWMFLTKTIKKAVAGSVSITHLPDLKFNKFAVPYRRGIVNRKAADWYVEVTDTREAGGNWYLYAFITVPLTHGSDTLDDAVILRESEIDKIIAKIPVLIKQGWWETPPKITKIVWTEVEGFLLKVDPNYMYNAGKYVTIMEWVLTDSLIN